MHRPGVSIALPDEKTIRILSWNILAMRGWCPGEHPEHSPGPTRFGVANELAEVIHRLKPDLVALQECPDLEATAGLARRLGMGLAYFEAGWKGNDHWPGGFPGAILSAHPMDDIRDETALSRDLPASCFERHWGSAMIHSPIGPLRVHAYHCCADWAGQRHDAIRQAEMEAVAGRVAPDLPTVLIGDHNARPGDPSLDVLTHHGLLDAHVCAGQGQGFTDPADEPTQRIDQCWVGGLEPTQCKVIQGLDLYVGRAGEGYYLSDHALLCVDLTRR